MRLGAAGWSISSHLPQEPRSLLLRVEQTRVRLDSRGSRRSVSTGSLGRDRGWYKPAASYSPIEQEASVQPHALRPPQQTEYPPGLCVVYPVNAEYT